MLAPLVGERAGHHQHAGLADGVRRDAGERRVCVQRVDVDDRAGLALDHVPADRLRQHESPAQVDVQDPVVFLHLVVLGLHALVHAGHADQGVDAPVPGDDVFHELRYVIRFGDVAYFEADRVLAAGDFLGGYRQCIRLSPGNDDVGVALRKAFRQCPPDAAARARHEHYLVLHGKQLVLHF